MAKDDKKGKGKEEPVMGQKKDVQVEVNVGDVLAPEKTRTLWGLRHTKKRIQAEKEMVGELKGLAENTKEFLRVQDDLYNIDEILETDALERKNRRDEVRRRAKISAKEDEIAERDADFRLAEINKKIKDLHAPPPEEPKEPTPVDELVNRRKKDQMIDDYLAEELEKINNKEADGVYDEKRAEHERKNLQNHVKKVKRGL